MPGARKDVILSAPADTGTSGVGIGFNARSITIQNPSSAWWYLPDQRTYVPPYTTGMIIFAGGTQNAKILYQAPVGIAQPTTSVIGSATFIYTDDELPPQQGLSAYGLVPPGANGDFVTLPSSGAATDYQLKGYAVTPSIIIYSGLGGTVEGMVTIEVSMSIDGGAEIAFDFVRFMMHTTGTPLGIVKLRLPYNLPARTRLRFTHTTTRTLSVVVLY